MRTETITRTYYKFSELSDEAKERARDWWREGALHYDWWDCIYEDAAQVGIKITGFDTGRSCDIEGHFTDAPERVAEKIIAGHGEHTGTAAEARAYQKTLAEFMAGAEKDEYGELSTYALDNEKDEIDREFLRALLEEYLTILRKEEEYQLSDEVADEMMVANDYEFTEDGKPV